MKIGKYLIFALTALLACAWLTATLAQAKEGETKQTTRQYTQKQIPDLIKLSRTNYATSYNDYTGQFIFEAHGDKGGYAKLHLNLEGFYLRPVLTLSQSKQGIIPEGVNYQDVYEFIPQSITAMASMNITRHCVAPKTYIYGNFSGGFSKAFVNPAPPNNESTDMSIPQWIYRAASAFLDDKLRFSFRVASKQPSGGQAWLTLNAYAIFDGVRTSKTRKSESKGKIYFGQNRNGKAHMSVRTGSVSWRLPNLILLNKEFSLEDISMDVSGAGQLAVDHCGPAYTQESDKSWHFRYRFTVAAKKEVKAVLKAVDGDSSSWAPVPDEVRTFEVTLEDPGPEEVEQVRFTLEDTSSHPGIATNAGNHLLKDQCADCTVGTEPQIIFRDSRFSHDDGSHYPIRRNYVHYNECPIDSLPDAFFSSRENPDLDFSEGGTKENLQYTISQSATRKDVEQDAVQAKVTIKDGAASFRIKAEVRVAGLWYPVRAEGPCAEQDNLYLRLPKDTDNNGVADDWQQKEGASGLDQDQDSLPNNNYYGDGLTVFEEYRGVYCQGAHQRLKPGKKDVFVHDYSKKFGSSLATVKELYEKQDVYLWRLKGAEFLDEVVNYQKSNHKKGDQYAVVVMALSQCPGLDFGNALGAAYESSPTQEFNTAVIHDTAYSHTGTATSLSEVLSGDTKKKAMQTLTGTLAHEIGHNLGIPHHGDGDGEFTTTLKSSGGRKIESAFYVACRGGEHSGRKDCFMKYNCADYFLDRDFVPQSWITRAVMGMRDKLKTFDKDTEYGAENYFCTDAQGEGVCGNARNGNCLGRLRVKSY